jgi:hypothetical protein
MAIVSILLGGMLGFVSAMVGLATMDISWLMALGLWVGVGTSAFAVILLKSMMPKAEGRVQTLHREA